MWCIRLLKWDWFKQTSGKVDICICKKKELCTPLQHKKSLYGVISLTTAKDINTLDDACVRNGRISYKINIDDALAKQAQTDKTKIK